MEQAADQTWMSCTLCRAGRTAVNTLQRAQSRAIEWPQPKTGFQNMNTDEVRAPRLPARLDTLNDAFSNLLVSMETNSRLCESYHKHEPHSHESSCAHYKRYHTQNHRPVISTATAHRSCDVQVVAPPGTYTVTTAVKAPVSRSKHRKTLHVVKLEHGEAVELNLHL